VRTPEYEEVAEAQRAFQFGLHDVADKLGRLLQSGSWKRFETPTGLRSGASTFEEFVRERRPLGLETNLETVRQVCGNHKWIRDLLDQELQRPVGTNQHTEGVENLNTRPDGESVEYALRRLRKDRPDLHQKVINEEMSPHAAAVQAGFRTRRFSISGDPKRAAPILLRHLSPDDVKELICLLKEGNA
jgi:hypothetical protein